MILTKQLFRDVKTALMHIPGHPGSSRLGEALARGFGFDDHHHAKTTFDANEAALDWLPKPAEFNDDAFLDFLDDLDGKVVSDMAATALFLIFGTLPIEDIDNYPVLKQGSILLLGVTPEPWIRAAVAYLGEAEHFFGDRTIIYIPRPGHWTYIDDDDGGTGLDDARYAYFKQADMFVFDDEMWAAMAAFDSDSDDRTGFMEFCDTAFLRIRDAIPENDRQWVRHMEVDTGGIRLCVAAGDGSDVRIHFLRVQMPSAAPA